MLKPKYRHECSWEEVQKQFPEFDMKDYINISSVIWAICQNANELAEANKLTKAQMKLTCISGSTGEYGSKIYKEECVKLLASDIFDD